MERVKIPGRGTIAYQKTGTGQEVIILINGAIFNLHQWDKLFIPGLMKRLTDRVTLIQYDYCGIGDSSERKHSFNLQDLADELYDFMSALKIETAHLLGISKGSMVGLAFSMKHPEMVKSFCGIGNPNIASSFPDRVIDTFRIRLRAVSVFKDMFNQRIDKNNHSIIFNAVYTPAIFEKNYDQLTLKEKIRNAIVKKMLFPMMRGTFVFSMHDLFEYYVRDDGIMAEKKFFKKGLEGLSGIPVLLIHGTKDKTLPVEMSREMISLIKGSRLLELEMGHLDPMLLKKYSIIVLDEYGEFVKNEFK